jgi:hypothetical protein
MRNNMREKIGEDPNPSINKCMFVKKIYCID